MFILGEENKAGGGQTQQVIVTHTVGKWQNWDLLRHVCFQSQISVCDDCFEDDSEGGGVAFKVWKKRGLILNPPSQFQGNISC